MSALRRLILHSCPLFLRILIFLLVTTHSAHAGSSQAALSAPVKTLTLGLNKTAIIDLDRDVRDIILSSQTICEAIVRTPRRVYLIGLQTGRTNAFFIGKDGEQILTLDISVEHDLSQMHAVIHRLIPGAKIRAETVNGDILLTGTVTNPVDAVTAADIAARFAGGQEHVINRLSVTSREQVLLKVTIAEVDRSAVKRLGIDVKRLATQAGNLAALGASETGFSVSGGAAPAAALDAAGKTLTVPAAGGALAAVWSAGSASLQAVVEAMEQANLMRMLAEPTLTSISGETANFQAGGELPVPTSRENNGVSVEWKSYGVGLAFTPVVLSEGRISLKIATEVSDVSADGGVAANGFSIPSLKVRRASSTVELPSGGSLVLAGLLSDNIKRSADGLPILRQVPMLGMLFESRDSTRSQTELVVIVTPSLVRAVDARMIARPDSGFDTSDNIGSAWKAVVAPAKPPRRQAERARDGFSLIEE